MRSARFTLGLALLLAPSILWPGSMALPGGMPDGAQPSQRVARLIKQLGHSDFALREAAARELEKIGEPALPALHQAEGTTGDAEVRARARQVSEAINRPLRAAAAQKELARWQGVWYGNGGQKLVIKGNRWLWGEPGPWQLDDTAKNRIEIIDVGDKHVHADLVVVDPAGDKICRAILRLDGDTLHYCGTYDAVRPTEFRTTANAVYVAWQRAKNGVPPPPPPPPPPPVEIDLHSEPFSTDLTLTESKAPIHRVLLTCQITDGGSGKLTLDPNSPKFDEFGQAIAEGKRLPEVRLNVTLKLVKKEAGLERYEIRGSKIASRMYLVAGAGVGGRLVVHGKDGKVRYLVNLEELLRFPPCHPGCFPAGTSVQVPGGTKAIDRIRESDLVITLDADGKPAPVKVTGVFETRNRVLTLRTTDGELITTETQPISLEKGGFTPAGELTPGDRIWRWTDGKRRATRVLDVSAADRETEVFNLILGEPTAFIAGGFVVRSKPPAAVVRQAPIVVP